MAKDNPTGLDSSDSWDLDILFNDICQENVNLALYDPKERSSEHLCGVDRDGVSSKNKDNVKDETNNTSVSSTPTITNNGEVQVTNQYSIHTKREKLLILGGSASAAIFSSMTTQIYLPALNVLARDLHVSASQINYTVTCYMILQGFVPMAMGGFADAVGRRPAFITCFFIYLAANIGLALSGNFISVIALRCTQAIGIAATQTLAQAVLSDLITSAERGSYMAIITLPAVLGTTVGPLVGGVLAQTWGWRSIFWFLTIAGGICLGVLITFFPETNRRLVGDGSLTPPPLYRTPWQIIKSRYGRRNQSRQTRVDERAAPISRHFGWKSLFRSFILLKNLEFTCLLIYGAIMYATIFAYATAIPHQLGEFYGFNSFKIGLMYLPIIGGVLAASFTIGKVMNWNYQRHAEKLGLGQVDRKQQMDLSNFPIERARLEIVVPLIPATAIITIGWGWALDTHTSIGVLCLLLFALGITYISVINVFNALISDYYRKAAATAVAMNWFIRCLVGAGMSAVILPLIGAIGVGWAYTLVAATLLLFSPLVLICMYKGLQWRQKRDGQNVTRNENC